MAEYKGSIELSGGLKPKNDRDFPLVSAHDVQVDGTGKRLDEKLGEIGAGCVNEIYVGNGDMPEDATIQILTDGSDAETELKNELKEYIDNNFGVLTLDKHTDGLIYLFRNGSPVGNGISITGEVIEGDVFGYVDENNNIVLRGALDNGAYTVKYEMDNGTIVNIGNMVLDNNVYYFVKNTLTNCSNSNDATTVVKDGSYTATLTPNSGYNISSVKITMGGTDITSSVYGNGMLHINNVTGDIEITATALANTYSVTKYLTDCSISNPAISVSHGDSYSATITANDGYELKSLTATMGGAPVGTSGGVIGIPIVTGNIVITAVAESSGPNNLANPNDTYWKDGHRLSIGSGGTSACEGHVVTNFIPAKMGDVLRVKGMDITAILNSQSSKIVMYSTKDTEGSKIGGLYGDTTATRDDCYGAKVTVNGEVSTYTLLYSNIGTQYATSNMNYIRLDGVLLDGYTKNDVIITINEEIS